MKLRVCKMLSDRHSSLLFAVGVTEYALSIVFRYQKCSSSGIRLYVFYFPCLFYMLRCGISFYDFVYYIVLMCMWQAKNDPSLNLIEMIRQKKKQFISVAKLAGEMMLETSRIIFIIVQTASRNSLRTHISIIFLDRKDFSTYFHEIVSYQI